MAIPELNINILMEISRYFGFRKDPDLSLLFKIFIIINAAKT